MAKPLESLPGNDAAIERNVFVAIDLGTTNSACAFAVGEKSGDIYASEKIPTVLLLDSDKKVLAFGKKARDRYRDLEDTDPDVDENVYYFDRFKMELYKGEEVRPDMRIQSANGRELPARIVFGKALEHYRQYAMQEIAEKTSVRCEEGEIKWILTVPAIWDDRAKLLMQTAAEEAGMNPDAVELALEPEGAAFRCRDDLQHVHRKIGSRPTLRYIVADCGGGTIDVTVHDMNMTTRKIDEVHRATGGDWGGTSVDEEIVDLVGRFLGPEVLDKVPAMEWTLFCRENIEEAKKKVGNTTEDTVSIALTPGITSAINQADEAFLLAASNFPNIKYRERKGSLSVFKQTLEMCYERSLSRIVYHIQEIASQVKPIDCILVVGGYSESNLLMERMEEEFNPDGVSVVRPKEASKAIVCGAVIFGQQPETVQSRKSKFSFGVRTTRPFRYGKDKPERMLQSDGGLVCKDIFETLVKRNESVPVGHCIEKMFTPASVTQTNFTIALYRSPNSNVEFVDEDGCKRFADLNVYSPHIEKGMDRVIVLQMNFSETLLKFKAYEKEGTNQDGKVYDCDVDFQWY